MAGPGYSGYFMKGLAGGLQSGITMGTNLTQLRWTKQKKKEIDDLNVKLADTWNAISQEIVSLANDGQLSDDDLLKVYALTMAAPYEMQSFMQPLRTSLSQFKTKEVENQIEYVKTLYEWAKGLDPRDIDSLYEGVRPYITDPHAKVLFEVCDKKLRHEYEVEKAEPTPEIFTSAEALREKYPKAGVSYTDEGYVPTFKEPTEGKAPGITDYNSAVNYLLKFKDSPPDTFNRIKAGFQSQFPNIDMSGITQESLREPEKAKGFRTTSLDTQEDYKMKALDANTLEDKRKVVDTYAKAGYDPSEMPTDEEWTTDKIGQLDALTEMLKEITDPEGKLLGDKNFNFMLGEEEETKTGEQWYRTIYEAYMFYLEELRKMGVDVSKYPKIKSPKEVSKVGFLKGAFAPGVERGYPSIYDTGTVPTPTRTETEPKLPIVYP
ncbi:hypothetical protein ES702_02254 [subsurface metagenome]